MLRRGISLLEMLVVMAIIALLAAFLTPALAKARTTSRTGQCASNLRTLGQLHLDQAMDQDRWARSAYDLLDGRLELVAPPQDSEGMFPQQDPPPYDDDRWFRRIHEAENSAPGQPEGFRIPCPEAIPLSEMSYAMNYWIPGKKPEHIVLTDVIFGCSPYRIAARGLDLRPGHSEQANFMWSDGHVALGGLDEIPDKAQFRRMRRADPVLFDYEND